MHRLASVTDDHVFHHPPHRVIEERDAEEGEAVRPGDEDGAEDDERDPRLSVEVFLKVKLIVIARGAAIDDRALRRRRDRGGRAAVLTRLRRLTRCAAQPPFARWTEVM